MYKLFGKRVLDIIIVVLAMLILSPLILMIIFLIKLFDRGPIFFNQKRVGSQGKVFVFHKFRSMPQHTGDIASDQIGELKLTWIGKIIRRTNLDELPQLYNIIKGDMAIVGPRPPIITQVELVKFRTDNGSINIKPGLTGLAQICSFDGMSAANKAEFDHEYAKDITFLKDITIILKTFGYLLRQPPVY